jgi:hypothetical protein
MKLNEWKETELFDMLMEKFVPKGKKGNKAGKLSDKEIAALEEPENEITKKDILNLRGVPLKEEETEEKKIEESPDETGY